LQQLQHHHGGTLQANSTGGRACGFISISIYESRDYYLLIGAMGTLLGAVFMESKAMQNS